MANGTSRRGSSIPRSSRRSISRSASGSAPDTRSFTTRISAPMRRSASSKPVREGINAHVAQCEHSIRHETAGDDKECRGRKIPRHIDRASQQASRPSYLDASTLHLHIRTEGLQHALAVIAGYRRFGYRSSSLCVNASEKDRGLYLGARHRQVVLNPVQLPPACDAHRRAPDSVSMFAPILRKGIATRSIGRCMSEASPISSESKRWPASNPVNSRIAVPELPMSREAPAALRPSLPTPSTTTPCSGPDLPAHRALACSRVWRGNPRSQGNR